MNCPFCTKSISIFFSFKYIFLFIVWETHVTSQDMSHMIWLGVWNTKCLWGDKSK